MVITAIHKTPVTLRECYNGIE